MFNKLFQNTLKKKNKIQLGKNLIETCPFPCVIKQQQMFQIHHVCIYTTIYIGIILLIFFPTNKSDLFSLFT